MRIANTASRTPCARSCTNAGPRSTWAACASTRPTSARDCLETANFMPMPPTNLVCADAEGNIAFRIAVFAPVRKGWSGRLPVPGTGEYQWGPEPRTDLPSEYNPARGYIATANNNTHPRDFKPPYAYYPAGARYRRHERIVQMITTAPIVHHRRHDPDAARLVQHRGGRGSAAVPGLDERGSRPWSGRARCWTAGIW